MIFRSIKKIATAIQEVGSKNIPNTRLRNSVEICNSLAVTFGFLIFPYIVLFFHMGFMDQVRELASYYVLTGLVIFANRFQLFTSAKLLLLFVSNFTIYRFGILFGPDTHIHMLFCAGFVTPCILFSEGTKRSYILMTVCLCIPFTGLLLMESSPPAIIAVSGLSLKILRWTTLCTLLLGTVIQQLYWIGLNQFSHAALTRNFTELAKAERRLKLSLDSVGMGVWDYDIATKNVTWDSSMLRIFDAPPTETGFTSERWTTSVHPDDLEAVRALFASAIEGKAEFKTKYRIRTPSGTTKYLSSLSSLQRDSDQRPTKLIGVTWDITTQEVQAESLRLQSEKLINANKMAALGEMAAGVAHEVNNPVAIIKGKANQMSAYLDEYCQKFPTENAVNKNYMESIRKVITQISDMCDRIAKIVNSLRAFSRDASEDPFEFVSIGQICEQTLDLCASRFENGSVELKRSGSVKCLIQCRGSEISQALLNLLNNAFDAVVVLDEKWVHLDVTETAHSVQITVTDSGKGIPKEIQSKLLQPFFTTKGVGKGTGLGLSLSLRIVTSHHGTLEFDSKSPNTRFVVTLPKFQSDLREAG